VSLQELLLTQLAEVDLRGRDYPSSYSKAEGVLGPVIPDGGRLVCRGSTLINLGLAYRDSNNLMSALRPLHDGLRHRCGRCTTGPLETIALQSLGEVLFRNSRVGRRGGVASGKRGRPGKGSAQRKPFNWLKRGSVTWLDTGIV